ncbi:MAG: hypothetical protein R3F62_11585 [Planctomycetota bacterium]
MDRSNWIWLGAVAALTAAAAAEPGALTLDTERVVVFKDGHGLVVKTARGVVAPDGTLFTEEVPDSAVLGCFWASASDGTTLGMRAGWHARREELQATTPCLSVVELLRANVGKTPDPDPDRGRALEGRIVELLEAPASPGTPRGAARRVGGQPAGGRGPGEPGADRAPGRAGRVPQRARAGDHDRAPAGGHEQAQAPELRLRPRARGEAFELRLIYFSEGLRWIPTYRVDLAEDDRARVSLQGEVLNELEDLEDVQPSSSSGCPTSASRARSRPWCSRAAARAAAAGGAGAAESDLQ